MALVLRETEYNSVPPKNDTLTYAELDGNFITLSDKDIFIQNLIDIRSGYGTPRYLYQNTDKVSIKLLAGTVLTLLSGTTWKVYQYSTDVIISTLDTGSLSNGKDYCVYLCDNGTSSGLFLISLNSSYPSGYNATNSRKIGGFHTLCVSVGTISGHPLTGYTASQILPNSVWDLTHKPRYANPNGMVYSKEIDKWVDIYLQSGTGTSTASVYQGTITDARIWNDHVDDGAAVYKRLLDDSQFQIIAEGSNQQTTVADNVDTVITGGWSDTAGRRMISNIGCEDCCGVMWQWLTDQAMRWDVSSTPWAYRNVVGNKGQLYLYGDYADVKLMAGGFWNDGVMCGSRSRNLYNFRWILHSNIGGRFVSEPL